MSSVNHLATFLLMLGFVVWRHKLRSALVYHTITRSSHMHTLSTIRYTCQANSKNQQPRDGVYWLLIVSTWLNLRTPSLRRTISRSPSAQPRRRLPQLLSSSPYMDSCSDLAMPRESTAHSLRFALCADVYIFGRGRWAGIWNGEMSSWICLLI